MVNRPSISTLLIDDEPAPRRFLEHLLQVYPDVEVVGQAGNVTEGMRLVEQLRPDLIFLDIEMPGANGFELLKLMRQQDIQTEVIFVTAYNQYAIEAIRAAALDYLLKPVDEEQLQAALSRFRMQRKKDSAGQYDKLLYYLEHPNRVRINIRSGFILIDPADIVFAAADGSYTEIFLKSGKKELASTNLGVILAELPAADFVRISRSTLINIQYLVRVNRLKHFCVIGFDGADLELKITRQYLKKLDDWVEGRIYKPT